MPVIEELAEFLLEGYKFLFAGEFADITELFAYFWDSSATLLIGWWEIFTGFFLTLILALN